MKWTPSFLFGLAVLYLLGAILCAIPTWWALDGKIDSLMARMRVVEDTALFAEKQLKDYTEQAEIVLTRQEAIFSAFKENAESTVRAMNERASEFTALMQRVDEDLELLEPVRQKRILRELRKQ